MDEYTSPYSLISTLYMLYPIDIEMSSTHSNPHHTGNSLLIYKKVSAEKMAIRPQDLNIVWGRDDRYWNIPDDGDIELCQVSWLEVTGCVNEMNPNEDYEVGFEVSLAPDAFGWGASPVYIMAKRGKDGKFAWAKFQVDPDKTGRFKIVGKSMRSQNNTDKSSADDKKLYFGLYEVWSGKWKGGLRIHYAYVAEI